MGWISLSSNLRYSFDINNLSNLWLKGLVPVATLSQQPHRLKSLPPRMQKSTRSSLLSKNGQQSNRDERIFESTLRLFATKSAATGHPDKLNWRSLSAPAKQNEGFHWAFSFDVDGAMRLQPKALVNVPMGCSRDQDTVRRAVRHRRSISRVKKMSPVESREPGMRWYVRHSMKLLMFCYRG